MMRFAFAAAVLAIGMSTVLAQGDPISERRNAMKAVGGATRDGAAMAKGEAPFDAAKAQAIFKVYSDAAGKLPSLYPETSKTGDTTASPRIWEDAAGFKAALDKFAADANAGASASADVASFRTAFGAATRNCASCHEAYRVKR